jgi:hypothetical protein
MSLHFTPVEPPLNDIEMWRAISNEHSFAISREIGQQPEVHAKPAFVASWRSRYNNKPAITVIGSPFATLTEAKQACEAMFVHLSRRVI